MGAAIARIFLESSESHFLVVVSRSKGSLDELSKFADRLEIITGDVCDTDIIDKAVSMAVSRFGSLDSVVANAGALDHVAPVESADVNGWKKLFDINFFSVVQLIKQAAPKLKESNGRLVVVLSGASTKGYHGWGAYGASKAALNHLVGTFATENSSITSISVAPGVVATDMQREIREIHSSNMLKDAEKFIKLYEENALLSPDIPARVYVNLAVRGWEPRLNGKYLRFDDDALQEYR